MTDERVDSISNGGGNPRSGCSTTSFTPVTPRFQSAAPTHCGEAAICQEVRDSAARGRLSAVRTLILTLGGAFLCSGYFHLGISVGEIGPVAIFISSTALPITSAVCFSS
jgi:hypothetical protein